MARFLVLDWDHKQLHVVAADVGKGGVRVRRAEVWAEERMPNAAEAEALGHSLRDRLKEVGIAGAPVLACIGRDRVILKELRIPAVPPHEEPAVVRFQAIKELTDAVEDVVIDYAASPPQAGVAERRALALIVRKELVDAYQKICQAAGLKLAGLTPRPFGVMACLAQKVGKGADTPAPTPADAAVAIVAVAESWAEFSVCRGESLLFSRSLAIGSTLAGEIRRNLAVYAGQAPLLPVAALYVAGGAEHAAFRDRLQTTLGLPVYSFDPVAGADKLDLPDGSRGGFAGAVGLLYAQASRTGLPINFTHPKQPKPPPDPNRQRNLVVALVAAALVGVVFAGGYIKLYLKDQKLATARLALVSLDNEDRLMSSDVTNFQAIQDWAISAPVYLDELYDSTAMFPDRYDLVKLSEWTGAEQKLAGKDKDWVARITMKGRTGPENVKLLNDFRNRFFLEPQNYRPEPLVTVPNARQGGRRGGPATLDFTLRVDSKKRPPAGFTRNLDIKPIERDRNGGGFDAGFGDIGAFGGGN